MTTLGRCPACGKDAWPRPPRDRIPPFEGYRYVHFPVLHPISSVLLDDVPETIACGATYLYDYEEQRWVR